MRQRHTRAPEPVGAGVRRRSGARTPSGAGESKPLVPTHSQSTEMSNVNCMPTQSHPEWRKDVWNIGLLLVLYFMQGIPIGLSASMPMFLVSHGASHTDQATFSLSSWPYSLKLLWAPLADALFITNFGLGRRKSWIIPTQLLAGLTMIWLGFNLNSIFGGALEGERVTAVDITTLTASCFVLYLLAATQDIAVDAWALTLLRPENVGLASTCNTVGQSAGIALGYGLLMALDSASFANSYVRAPLGWPTQSYGLVTVSNFFLGAGLFFMLFTVGLWAFKEEVDPYLRPSPSSSAQTSPVLRPIAPTATANSIDMVPPRKDSLENGTLRRRSPPTESEAMAAASEAAAASESSPMLAAPAPGQNMAAVKQAYFDFARMLKLPAVQSLLLVLLTVRVGTSVADNVTSVAMQEHGVTKESIAFMDVISTPLQLFIQVMLAPITAGSQPLTIFLQAYPVRIAVALMWVMVIAWLLPDFAGQRAVSTSTLAVIFSLSNFHSAVGGVVVAAQMAFFSQISDPASGATYVTMLNTFANMGSMWPRYMGFRLIDVLSTVTCRDRDTLEALPKYTCSGTSAKAACVATNGACVADVEGYHVLVVACAVVGLGWYFLMRGRVTALQRLPPAAWRLPPT